MAGSGGFHPPYALGDDAVTVATVSTAPRPPSRGLAVMGRTSTQEAPARGLGPRRIDRPTVEEGVRPWPI